MVFKDIFDFVRNSSSVGANAETEVSGYLPKKPNEEVSMPPHDPWKSVTVTQQDPKIVRETSPQTQVIFEFIGELTSSIKQSGDKIETAMSDPETVVAPSEQVMHSSEGIARNVTDDVPSPSNKDNEPQDKE